MDKICELLQNLKEKAKENFVPIVRDQTLDILLKICKEINAKEVLEIGTATGYSGLNLLSLQNVYLTTIEKNAMRFAEAKANFESANVADKTKMILGDAGEILEKLKNENKRFDFVFLDGPKGQYYRYLPHIKEMLNDGGVLFADNILLGGLVKDESRVNHKNRAMVNKMKTFLKEIKEDKDFQTQIFELDDGFAVCKKLYKK